MTENEQYVADSITKYVWSGFYSHGDIDQMIDDIAEEDCNIAELKSLVGPALRSKSRAERTWPAVTDCDCLDRVFHDLHDAGICALANAGYTMSDGHSVIAEVVAAAPPKHYHGYCFYYGQDVERAIEGHGVMIAFGDLSNDSGRNVEVGQTVSKALRVAGFIIDWDGSTERRITIPAFHWQKRARLE